MSLPLTECAFFTEGLDLMVAVDDRGRCALANAAWASLGWSPETLARRRILEWVHPEDRADARAVVLRGWSSGAVLEGVSRFRTAKGEWRALEWRGRARGRGFVFSARDVTDRVAAFEGLRRTTQRLEHVVELSGAGSWDVDLVHNRLFWDANTRAIHEVPEDYDPCLEEAINFYEPSVRPVVEAQVQRAIEHGIPWVMELPLRTYLGHRRIVRAIGQAVRENGAVVGLVGAFEDVTVRKEYEDDLHRARLEAERSNVEKSQFLANMSHELRTPMAGVLGMLDAILDEPLPETTAFHAGVARECATGLLAILNDILDYSKLEANEVHLERLDYSPQRLLDGVLSMFAARAKEKGLRLDVALDAAVPDWVVGDPTRIRQILVNLVGNAVKFTPTGGVRIEVVRIEEETIFRVADTGIGLSLDQQQRLFQRFAQADASTTRRFGGTGLGLAISKQLAELMGGAIGVDSVEGEGSTFWFTVPSPEGTPVEGEGTLARSPSEDLAGLHVLAAEDNRVNQMVLERVLVKRGHEVTLVEDGEAALRAVAKGRFDVVLMDIQMPVMDGLEATRKIRDLPEGERVPIVALTANAMAGDRERYLEAGMDDYASKPLDAERLASAMARAIAKRRRGLEL